MKSPAKFTFFPVLIIFGMFSACQNPIPQEKLPSLMDKYITYWNTGDFEGIEEVVHAGFELRMTPDFTPEKGIGALKDEIFRTRAAYPDFHVSVEEVVYDDDKMALLWTITATHTGTGMIPATGKPIHVMGMSIIHVEEGKIRDEWIASNNLLWMTQLGYILKPFETGSGEE